MRGPQGPNAYEELKPGQAEENLPPLSDEQQQRLAAHLTPPPPEMVQERMRDPRAEPTPWVRSDNAELVAERAAQETEARRVQDAKQISAEADAARDTLIKQTEVMRELHTRYDALGQNPADLVEEKALSRAGGREAPDCHFHAAMQESVGEADPYDRLRKAAEAEHAAFTAEQAAMQQRIDDADSKDAKNSLQQRKNIQAHDYLASAHDRIADQAELISGQHDEGIDISRAEADRQRDLSADIQAEYSRRTGRTDGAEPMAADAQPSSEAVEQPATTQERFESKGAEAARTSDLSSSRPNAEWRDAGAELTDDQRERLANLDTDSFGGGHDGPTRPQSSGREL